MKKITASAPGKLLLFGDHAVVFGWPCIVTAVDRRVYVSVERLADDVWEVEAPEVGVSEVSGGAVQKKISEVGAGVGPAPKATAFLEQTYCIFAQKFPEKVSAGGGGLRVETRSEFSAAYGFGSSSATTVAFARALCAVYGVALTAKELFDLCYEVVLAVQGVGSGFDVAAAVWGGTLLYVKGAKVVEPLSGVGGALDNVLDLPIIVGYTGIKADTATLVGAVKKMYESDGEVGRKVAEIFAESGRVTEAAKVALMAKDWRKVGALMQENQELLRELEVSSPELERLIAASEGAGAFGAKLSGAGGGDCMVAVVGRVDPESARLRLAVQDDESLGQILRCAQDDRSAPEDWNAQDDVSIEKVSAAIAAAGGEVLPVQFGAAGVRLEPSEGKN